MGLYTHRLDGIPAGSVPGWLATLGLLGICAEPAGSREHVGPAAATLGWEVVAEMPVPVLRCPLSEHELLERVTAALKALGDAVVDNTMTTNGGVKDHPVKKEWQQLRLPGQRAVELVKCHQPKLRVMRGPSVDELPAIFCRAGRDGSVALTDLLCGVTAQVRIGPIVSNLANVIDDSDVRATLFGPWQPTVGSGSLGFDWMTVSDASKGAGEPASLPARDLLALLGAAWTPRAPRRHLLVWPAWKAYLGASDVATLITRPELVTVGTASQTLGGRTNRNVRSALRELQADLQAWSVTHVMVSRAVRRTLHSQSDYRVWEEAKLIDVRALQRRLES